MKMLPGKWSSIVIQIFVHSASDVYSLVQSNSCIFHNKAYKGYAGSFTAHSIFCGYRFCLCCSIHSQPAVVLELVGSSFPFCSILLFLSFITVNSILSQILVCSMDLMKLLITFSIGRNCRTHSILMFWFLLLRDPLVLNFSSRLFSISSAINELV